MNVTVVSILGSRPHSYFLLGFVISSGLREIMTAQVIFLLMASCAISVIFIKYLG